MIAVSRQVCASSDRRLPRRLTAVLAGLMTVQSVAGLLRPSIYRDVEWIRARGSATMASP